MSKESHSTINVSRKSQTTINGVENDVKRPCEFEVARKKSLSVTVSVTVRLECIIHYKSIRKCEFEVTL